MNINITGRDFELTPSLETFVTEKIEKLTKFDEKIENVHVILSANDGHHKKGDIFTAEFVIDRDGKNLTAKEITDDIHTAIDLALAKAKIQVDKLNEKNHRPKPGIKGVLKGFFRRQ